MNRDDQRVELHKTIWRIATDLRGSVDGWDFKQYVLGLLFYRFVSENLTTYLSQAERDAGVADFDYAKLPDQDADFGRQETVAEKGFYILPSELFENVRAGARHDENLNETLERVFENIEKSAVGTDSEYDLKGLFDDLDVNSSKLGNTVAKRNEKLVRLLEAVGDLKLGQFGDNEIDAFGDAYEFLMTMYASSAGKSGGEFFTPQEVSELLARLTVVGKTAVNKVYDPACGSGSLLLKYAKVLGRENVRRGFFGQETNLTTYNLCRINMFLHDINYEKFDIAHGDTLVDPAHWDEEPFEAIVSNPPYSTKWDGDTNPLLINDPRFAPAGVLAPKSKADLAFVMHILSWLAVNGTAAIVVFPGVLYRSGAEQRIRKYLIENNYVDTVVQLPPDLFFGTPISTCVLVLKKSKFDNNVLFINASNGFARTGNKNKVRDQDQRAIVDCFTNREEVDHFGRLVPNETIADNAYNLSVSSWVEAKHESSDVDLASVNESLTQLVVRQEELRTTIEETVSGDNLAKLLPDDVKMVPLGDLGLFNRGKRFTKGDYVEAGLGCIHYGQIYTHYGTTAVETLTYVDSKLRGQLRLAHYGDLVIAATGENVKDVCKAVAWLGEEEVAVHDDCYIFRHTLDPRYVSYVFQSAGFHERKLKHISESKVVRVSGANLAKISIPVPTLEVQLQIVSILDKFEVLINELLPSEIDARRVQYEYYRDNLLRFGDARL